MLGRVFTAVPAAGSALRMGLGYSKAYVDVAGKPLLAWTLQGLIASPFVDRIVVAVRPDEVSLCRGEIVGKLGFVGKVDVVAGGADRQASVASLLREIPKERDLILIHDGARPLVSERLIQRVLEAAAQWGAAMAALPVMDTVKESANGGETVSGTVDRKNLYRAQTPQAFHRDLILSAHRRAVKEGWEVTDDASLIEQMGHDVRIVEGEEMNFKVTTLEDLEILRWIIRSRRS